MRLKANLLRRSRGGMLLSSLHREVVKGGLRQPLLRLPTFLYIIGLGGNNSAYSLVSRLIMPAVSVGMTVR
jgi:hypothetical protein